MNGTPVNMLTTLVNVLSKGNTSKVGAYVSGLTENSCTLKITRNCIFETIRIVSHAQFAYGLCNKSLALRHVCQKYRTDVIYNSNRAKY